MSIRTSWRRGRKYVERHGLPSSIRRIVKEFHNRTRFNRDVVYWRDLHTGDFNGHALPAGYRVERLEAAADVPNRLLQSLSEHYSAELVRDQIRERFEKGAVLWCLRTDDAEIGFTWSIAGKAMKPYFFPLMESDVYLFDGLVFPAHRGRGLNSVLMNHILRHHKNSGFLRAYGETAEWNSAEMKSLAKNGFVRIGLARKRFRRGRCRVTWWL